MKSHDDTTQRVRVPMLRPRVIEQHDGYEIFYAAPVEQDTQRVRRLSDDEITRPVKVHISDLSGY